VRRSELTLFSKDVKSCGYDTGRCEGKKWDIVSKSRTNIFYSF